MTDLSPNAKRFLWMIPVYLALFAAGAAQIINEPVVMGGTPFPAEHKFGGICE